MNNYIDDYTLISFFNWNYYLLTIQFIVQFVKLFDVSSIVFMSVFYFFFRKLRTRGIYPVSLSPCWGKYAFVLGRVRCYECHPRMCVCLCVWVSVCASMSIIFNSSFVYFRIFLLKSLSNTHTRTRTHNQITQSPLSAKSVQQITVYIRHLQFTNYSVIAYTEVKRQQTKGPVLPVAMKESEPVDRSNSFIQKSLSESK